MENTEFNFETLPIVVSYVGETVRDNNWQCDQWRVTIGEGKAQFTTDYFTGFGHRKLKARHWSPPRGVSKNSIAYQQWEKDNIVPVKPDNKGIMYSLLSDSEAANYSFNDWCDNFGYSNDSIQAFNTYQLCCSIGEKLRKVFSRDEIAAMRIALEDY